MLVKRITFWFFNYFFIFFLNFDIWVIKFNYDPLIVYDDNDKNIL